MRAFQPMPADLMRHLIAGEEDELTGAMDQRISSIKRTPCPRCGASLHPQIHPVSPFISDDPLPRMIATCECGFAQDPVTGLVIDLGSAAKVEDPLPIIKPSDD